MAAIGLIFLGPPGTGKGTQAARLAEKFDLQAMSSGDVLRKELKAGSDIGKQAEQFMKAGTLVPDAVITGVMLSAVDRLEAGKGFILDGFPRTVPQAEALEDGLKERNLPISAVVDFQLDDQEIVRRIVTRRVCSNCGATYNTEFMPPKVDNVCDKCGGEVAQRLDDREEVVRTRLQTYREQTAPLIGFYEQRGLLQTVDATGGADAVEKAVTEIVERVSQAG